MFSVQQEPFNRSYHIIPNDNSVTLLYFSHSAIDLTGHIQADPNSSYVLCESLKCSRPFPHAFHSVCLMNSRRRISSGLMQGYISVTEIDFPLHNIGYWVFFYLI